VHSTGFAALRFGNQKRTVDALKSESRIANTNAQMAYQRYQQSPTRLNLLISKYSDLNADLRDAAHHFQVINSGTFGQSLKSSFGLFGGTSSGLFGGSGLVSFVVQKKERDELEDIQDRMKRVGRDIQNEVRQAQAQQKGQSAQVSLSAGVQGSVAQRMVAMNTYGRPTRN